VKILLVTWDCGGNIPPFLGLGSELARRGHRVSCLGPSRLRKRLTRAEVEFIAYEHGATFDPTARQSLTDSQRAYSDVFFGDGMAADVHAVCAREKPDFLVIDFCMVSAMAAAERSGLPFAILVHTLPGCIFPIWDTRGYLPHINTARARCGLAPLAESQDLWTRGDRILAVTARELDGLGSGHLPEKLHYVGPIFEPDGAGANIRIPNPPADGRPEVLASFSTTFMEQEQSLGQVIAALSGLELQGWVTTGPAIDPSMVPGHANVGVFQYLPHAILFPRIAAAILHGGHSSVAKALWFGVPMLCMPHGRDQMYVSERVEKLGLGLVLPKDAEAREIAAAVSELLNDGALRERCRQFARELRASGSGANNAVDILEEAVRFRSRQRQLA